MSARRWLPLGLGALGPGADPARSADPRVQAVVAGLGAVALPLPRAGFRDELRAQLVAVTPTLVGEARPEPALAGRSAHRHRRTFPVARVVRAATATVVVLGLLLAAGVWASRDALPGDALYSLKRGWESVRLHFTHGTDRGRTYLAYAGNRADEVSALVARASADGTGPIASAALSDHTATLITATLNAADADLRDGSTILIQQAGRQRSADPLDILIRWAPDQQSVLRSIQTRLPAGVTRDRVMSSLARLDSVTVRANALAPLARCGCFARLPSDQLGPLPPGAAPSGTVRPGSPGPGVPTAPVSPGGGGNPGGGSTGPGATRGPLPSPSLPSGPSLPTRLPSLPSRLPLPSSLPIPSLPFPTLTLPHLHAAVLAQR